MNALGSLPSSAQYSLTSAHMRCFASSTSLSAILPASAARFAAASTSETVAALAGFLEGLAGLSASCCAIAASTSSALAMLSVEPMPSMPRARPTAEVSQFSM